MIRLACLISGSGSTMQAIAQATQPGGQLEGKCQVVVVIASAPTAGGIAKARALGIPVEIAMPFAPHHAFGEALGGTLLRYQPDVVGQYGWMPKTPANVVEAYAGRMINQHPGPLDPGHRDVDGKQLDFGGPGMYGLRVHAAVLEFARTCGRDFPCTEATAQYVAPDFDAGAVIGRVAVPIEPADDPYSLAQRVLPAEHALQINTVLDFTNGTVQPQVRHPLLRRDEDIKLWQAKTVARRLFPKG